jgi:two-component sensor histidine kinase/ligand-binding sensor domain-containing protein
MKHSKHIKLLAFTITLSLLFAVVPTAYSLDLASIKFNRVFETGGYNFDIVQDKEGFIWVATINGAKFFNGYEVKSYEAGEKTLPSNNVRTIFVDSEGLIWFATLGGLAVYNKKTDSFTTFLPDPDNPNSINSRVFNETPNLIAESEDGILWFGTIKGLNSFDKKTQLFTHYVNDPHDRNSLSDNSILSVLVDRDGLVWIGTKEGGLNKFDRKTKTFNHYIHDPENRDKAKDIGIGEISSVVEDKDGGLWIGTSKSGLKKFDKTTETFTHFQHDPGDSTSLADNNIKVIVPVSDGSLWICHPWWVTVGIERFDRNSRNFTQYRHDPNHPDSTTSDRVQVAFEDNSGILWIGENLSTISTFDKNFHKFNLYKPSPVDNNGVIKNIIAIVEDSNKDIWLGSGTEGLAKYNRETDSFTIFSHDLNFPGEKNLTSLYEDSSGNFWINTNNGMLGLFDTKTRKFKKRYHNPNLTEAWSIVEDPENPDILWLSTFSNGIHRFNKRTEEFKTYKYDNLNEPLSHLLGVHTDNENNLWFTSESNGLLRYDRKMDGLKAYLHNANDPKSISSNNINFFYVSALNTLWVSTQNGLNKFHKNTETFERYGTEAGFHSNIRGILEDEEGNLWISSDFGLLKFDIKLERVVKKYLEGGREFKFSPLSAMKTRDGEMWFSSNLGIIRFDPRAVKDNSFVPPIYLTSITQGGKKIEIGMTPEGVKKIELDWQNNFFEFEYLALNYTRSENNNYAYFMQGLDKNWYYSDTDRHGRYSGIPPGEYVLRIKGSNNDGIWNEEGVSIAIKISPPFWRTWLFYFACGVLAMGIILLVGYYYLKLRTKQLLVEQSIQREKLTNEHLIEKEIILKEVHHRIRNNMSTIRGLLSLQSSTLGNNPDAVNALKVAENRIQSMLVLYDKLFLSTDYTNVSTKKYFETLIDDVIKNFSQKAVINVTYKIEDVMLDAKSIFNLGIVINELITNTMKHAFIGKESGKIISSLSVDQGHVVVTIQDNGVEIPESVSFENPSNGFGFKLVSMLVKQLDGSIQIERGEGTKFTIKFNIET